MKKSIEIPLPNGYTVFIDNSNHKGINGIMICLISPEDYIITDRILTDETAEWLRKVVSREEQ